MAGLSFLNDSSKLSALHSAEWISKKDKAEKIVRAWICLAPGDIKTAALAKKLKVLGLEIPQAWQSKLLEKKWATLQSTFRFDLPGGPLWVVRLNTQKKNTNLNFKSAYTLARDEAGAAVNQCVALSLDEIVFASLGADETALKGALLGADLALYRYKGLVQRPKIKLLEKSQASILASAQRLGEAMNFARHLVNMPPCDLNPLTYSEILKTRFAKSKTVKVDVWDTDRVKAEKMGLLWSAGRGAEEGARLVCLRYRPSGTKTSKKKTFAFVGKGVTFDSGGLDIKNPSNMRLMKKDMGGSASLAGLCVWLENSGLNLKCDFYLALAENAISAQAFHPGDILVSRNGKKVEVNDTDAEGRLVLADAIDVALTQKELPSVLINAATLTGAARVALGPELGFMTCNHDELAADLGRAAELAGDLHWRMPLYEKYRSFLKSETTGLSNCSDTGFGGAITASLFLKEFVNKSVQWAHFDIFCWSSSPDGAVGETGGNGQLIQCLTEYLTAES